MTGHVIMEIGGGLGNQMFQYAYIKALSKRNNLDFKLNILGYKIYPLRNYELNIFNIKGQYAKNEDLPYYFYRKPSVLKGLAIRLNINHHWDMSNYFNPLLFKPKYLNLKGGYISGHFLCEKYFIDQWDKIKDDFVFTKQISSQCKTVENTIKDLNTCSIHLRRGDYLKYPYIYIQFLNIIIMIRQLKLLNKNWIIQHLLYFLMI